MVRTLSASQVNKYFGCPRKWAFEYLQKLKPEPEYPMQKGTFVHAAIEDLNEELSNVAYEGQSPGDLRSMIYERLDEIIPACRDEGLAEPFEEQFRANWETLQGFLDNYVETVIDRFGALRNRPDIDCSDDEAWERCVPDANELDVCVNHEGSWYFRGSIDAGFEKHPLWFDRTVLVDYKTGSSPYDSDEPMDVKYSRQLDLYAWMYWQAFEVIPDVCGLHFLGESPDSDTAFVFQENDPGTVIEAHLLLEHLQEELENRDPDTFRKNTDYTWCRFEKNDGEVLKCDHYDYCQANAETPDPRDPDFTGRDSDPIDVELSDPTEADLEMAEKADPVLKTDADENESTDEQELSTPKEPLEGSSSPFARPDTNTTNGSNGTGETDQTDENPLSIGEQKSIFDG